MRLTATPMLRASKVTLDVWGVMISASGRFEHALDLLGLHRLHQPLLLLGSIDLFHWVVGDVLLQLNQAKTSACWQAKKSELPLQSRSSLDVVCTLRLGLLHIVFWWRRVGSNHRPRDYEALALAA